MLAALVIGFGLAAVAEYFDKTLRTESDVRAALNLMVLATVPYISDSRAMARGLRRKLVFGAGAASLMVVCAAVAWRLLR
jgi:hypothetical protein